MRVRITELLREPRRGVAHGKAQLLGELAVECRTRRFAGLELAAGKLPVAGVGLAGRALRQQHAAIRALEDRGGDLHERLAHAPDLRRSPAAPA